MLSLHSSLHTITFSSTCYNWWMSCVLCFPFLFNLIAMKARRKWERKKKKGAHYIPSHFHSFPLSLFVLFLFLSFGSFHASISFHYKRTKERKKKRERKTKWKGMVMNGMEWREARIPFTFFFRPFPRYEKRKNMKKNKRFLVCSLLLIQHTSLFSLCWSESKGHN